MHDATEMKKGWGGGPESIVIPVACGIRVRHTGPVRGSSTAVARRAGASLCWATVALLLALAPAAGWADAAFLEIDAPREPRSTVEEALIEIEGHGGTRRGELHDVVIALDVSESTLEDSGLELDSDLPADRTDPALLEWLLSQEGGERLAKKLDTQDFDDTVLAAEIEAARALVSRLDPKRFRVAVLTFAEDARKAATLGSSRSELLAALDGLPRDLHVEAAGTNYQAAIQLANEMLRPELGKPDDHLRSIVFLSDGAPTRPVLGDRAARYALEAARESARAGIRLFAFAIGPEAEAGVAVLEQMAGWTAGKLHRVTRPAMIVNRLRELDLVGLVDLEVRNVTTKGEARALRIFPDGSFDGFVELAEGANTLRFRAKGEDGDVHQVERVVTYRAPAGSDQAPAVASGPDGSPAADAATDPLIEKLKQRTAEIEAWRDFADKRRQRKEVEIEPARRPRY